MYLTNLQGRRHHDVTKDYGEIAKLWCFNFQT